MARSGVSIELHAGFDLGRKRLDYRLLDEHGDHVEVGAARAEPTGSLRDPA